MAEGGKKDGPRIAALLRYPVKGLSAQRLDRATLAPGEAMPLDRAWAIENGPGAFDPAAPRYLPKTHFLMLMRNERLAALDTRFDEESRSLTIHRSGKPVVTGNLETRAGRAVLEQFLAAYMKDALRGSPRIVSAEGHSFSDMEEKCLHLINLASVREVERAMGRPVDPLRFRANIVIDATEPWEEFTWAGREIAAGGVRLAVTGRTSRCAATNVDPATGARDLDIPAKLARRFGHTDFGVYATVISGGVLAAGDRLSIGDRRLS